MSSKVETWTNDDFLAGLCSHLDIGKPKELEQSPLGEALQSKPYSEKLAELGEAALDVVLTHPGGPAKWFKDNPSAHVRILTKLATPAAESQARVVVEIPWLQTGRLSYRNPPPETVQDVEPKAAAESWKEPPPPADVSLGMAILKKSLNGN